MKIKKLKKQKDNYNDILTNLFKRELIKEGFWMTISSETLHIFICFIVKIGYTKGEQTFYFVPWRLVIMTTYTFFLNILFTFQNLKIRCWGVLLHFSRLQRACILYNVYIHSIFKFISSSFNNKKTQGWEFAHRFSKRSSEFPALKKLRGEIHICAA